MNIEHDLKFDDRVDKLKIPKTYEHKQGLAFVFLDTETTQELRSSEASKAFKLGVLCHCYYGMDGVLLYESYKHCKTIQDIHDGLAGCLKQDGYVNIVAHNMSFDFQVADLQTWLDSTGYKITMWYQQMTVTFITATNGVRYIRVLDNMNWWPMSLKRVGEAIGVQKGEVDFESCTYEELMSYCQQDVKVMVDAFSIYWQMIYDNFGIRPKWTNGSTAMACFASLQDSQDITLHKSADVIRASYEAYFGGRVEVFRQGEFNEGPYHKVDVNSLYPYVMTCRNYPARFCTKLVNPDMDTVRGLLAENLLLCDCAIMTDIPSYPYRQDYRGIYPIGKFRTWLTGDELLNAIRLNHVLSVNTLYLFTAKPIFQTYVHKLIDLKERYSRENNWGKREVTKRLLNSLYGKFAQMGFTRKEVGYYPGLPYWRGKNIVGGEGKAVQIEVLNNIMYEYVKDLVLPTTVPIISANVTANSRAYMWDLFNIAGLENCYYSDTDSIIVNDMGLDNLKHLMHDSELGKLKHEGTVDTITIFGPKSYLWGEKRIIKGLPKSAKQRKDGMYQYDSFRTLNNAVFESSEGRYFLDTKYRTLNFTLPSGYTVHNTYVKPPILNKIWGYA